MREFKTENISDAVEGLKGIAHEVRLSVLCHLQNGPMTVNDLAEEIDVSQSNLSQHLAKMRLIGLIETEKEGSYVYYRIADPAFIKLISALNSIYCSK